jgi:hypothetical protein
MPLEQTTQDAVRHQPTTTAKKQKKATFVAMNCTPIVRQRNSNDLGCFYVKTYI